jgi:hypothetical protein
MNKNKLRKQIEQYYRSHNQHLIVDTYEMIQDNEHDDCFEIYLANSDIFLFTIQNYNGLCDLKLADQSYFRDPKCRIIQTWDGVRASFIPLYFDNIFTLKTFKSITKKDIIYTTDYFIHEILEMWGIFNIKYNDEVKE